ncbi:heavy metal-associated isoprenylated plant protein 30 [Ananas comosus]|nr:heavy metal-associated isoprenylated plant protein 30 [Ananas comosus]
MANKLQIVPAIKNVEPQYVEMKVPLYSYGCEKKIKKALSHLRGIHSVDVDYRLEKVTVWGICNRDDVLATIRKKRRGAHFWDESTPEIHKEGDPAEERAEIKKISRLASFNSNKFRKSWKKLFPIVLY